MESSNAKKRGMVLPFEPHAITFDEIVYSVDMPQVNHYDGFISKLQYYSIELEF